MGAEHTRLSVPLSTGRGCQERGKVRVLGHLDRPRLVVRSK